MVMKSTRAVAVIIHAVSPGLRESAPATEGKTKITKARITSSNINTALILSGLMIVMTRKHKTKPVASDAEAQAVNGSNGEAQL